MSDNFTGRWLVTEYVFNPDGSFAGVVKQKRHLEHLSDTRLRVIQDCEPSSDLVNHPMNRFRGFWEFDLEVNGHHREYLGKDVIGTGFSYGEKTMIGQGVWTRFGYNFTSFGFLLTPHRQLTGGTFFHANQMVARIVGVACPETKDSPDDFTELRHDISAQTLAIQWRGTLVRYDSSGDLVQETEVLCNYEDSQIFISELPSKRMIIRFGYQEEYDLISGTHFLEQEAVTSVGKRKQYGCLLDQVLFSSDGIKLQVKTILDAKTKTIIMIQKWRKAQKEQVTDILEFSTLF